MKFIKKIKPFFNVEWKDPLDWVSLIILLLVFSTIVLRSVSIDLHYDEAYSYMNTGRIQDVWKIYQFRIANTHIINSLAMTVTTLFFPYNDFMIRLPNLITSIFFLFTALNLSKLYKNRLLLFSLLVLFHFMITFMAQARGYGMSAAFLLASFFVYKNKEQFNSPFNWIAILLLLSFYSNYVALFPAAAFAGYIWMTDLKFKTPPFSKKQNYKYGGFTLLGIYGFFSVTKEGKPLYGDYEGNFFKAVPIDFVELFSPSLEFSQLAVSIISVVFAILVLILFFKKKIIPAAFSVTLAFVVITALSFISGKPLPTGRVLIPFWPF